MTTIFKTEIQGVQMDFETLQEIVIHCRNLGMLPANNPDGSPVRGNPQMILHPLIKSGLVKIEGLKPIESPQNILPLQTVQPPVNVDNNELQLLQALKNITGQSSKSIDADQVRDIVRAELSKIETAPKVIEVKIPNSPAVKFDCVHKNFELLLKSCMARVNVYLYGETGSGKTTAGEMVAKSLNIPFYAESFSKQAALYQLMGHIAPDGQYIESKLYKAFSSGGVFLCDEMDRTNENILLSLNMVAANKIAAFPCGMVEKHKNFVLIAGGNTLGKGASSKYTGAVNLDQATLDRFDFINWEYDNDLEKKVCPDSEVLNTVLKLRDKAKKLGLNCSISPRAWISICNLMKVGIDKETAFNMAIYNKLSETDKNQLMN